MRSEQLKVVLVGHVDHGKSTLVGRLMYETGTLQEGKLEQLQKVAAARRMPFEWANLMDALKAERDQNVTIDTAQIWFRTARRQYVLIDAPGHKEFLKNMITGAASADAALLLIDAAEGVQEQSRRHGYLLNLLGVRQIVVLVNKMDLRGYAQEVFEEIQKEFQCFLASLGLQAQCFIPIVARAGDNLISPSANMAWWGGPTVVAALDQFTEPVIPRDQPLRFPIQDVYRFDHRRILAGRIESGTLQVGDRLVVRPGLKASTVQSIECWNTPGKKIAEAGESIGITLAEPLFVARGAVGALESSPPCELPRFKARIFWLGRTALRLGQKYRLKLSTQDVECQVEEITEIIDASTLGTVPRAGQEAFVERHEVADVYLRTKSPLVFDPHCQIRPMGRFVLVDGLDIAGGGIILDDNYPVRTADWLHKSRNIYWSTGQVTAHDRELLNGHRGMVLWMTGLSGSGKSTIATELEGRLCHLGCRAYVLDGDKVRHGLCSDLAFTPEDRKENIRRIGEVAKLFADAGLICITALISPYRSDRELARRLCKEGHFVEVYVNAPIEVCQQRDPKGLYAKARAGQIKNFTGVSAPYEAPEQPELELRTDQLNVSESVERILRYLEQALGFRRGTDQDQSTEQKG